MEENLVAAARKGRWTREAVEDLFPRLHERRQQYAHSLSGGEQQMLAHRPRALIDQSDRCSFWTRPRKGLAPVIRHDIWRVIRKLKDEGQSILIADKSLSELLPAADRCFVLEKGVTGMGRTAERTDARPPGPVSGCLNI